MPHAGEFEFSAQIALAWLIAQPGIIAIPKAGSVAHVEQNRQAAAIKLSDDDWAVLDLAFPPPTRRCASEMPKTAGLR